MKPKIVAILLLAIFMVSAIIYSIIHNPNLFQDLILRYGAVGLFLATLFANATILFPVPIDILIFISAQIDFFGLGSATPLILAIFLALAATVGESTAYIMGYYSTKSLQQMTRNEMAKLEKMKKMLQRFGAPLIVIASLTPLPMDIVGIAAGMIQYSFKKFFIFCYTGKAVRYVLILFAGYYSLNFIRGLFGF